MIGAEKFLLIDKIGSLSIFSKLNTSLSFEIINISSLSKLPALENSAIE